MKRTFYAALAAAVALPMLATSAGAQQGLGYGYGQSGEPGYHWSERRGTDRDHHGGDRGAWGWRPMADDRWAHRDAPRRDFEWPVPPPGYDDDRGGYDRGWRDEHGVDPYAGHGWRDDGRHAGYGRDHMRHDDRGGHHHGWRDERGVDPTAGRGWRRHDCHHQAMRARHHGHEDMDVRRDFPQDGRRGSYQDPSYESMPLRDRDPRADRGRGPVDMRGIRDAMRMIDRFDVDGDNRVTQEEIDRYRSDRLVQFDTDADRQLTLEEYSALWSDAMRERMVRRFQSHDRDGDGVVTVAEFSEQTQDLVRMRDRNRDDALSEEDFMRPRVEAPMGGVPNQPAESHVPGDDDVADVGERPEVEAPIEGTPNDAADEAEGTPSN